MNQHLTTEILLQRLQTRFSQSESRYIIRCLIEDLLNKKEVEDDDIIRLSKAVDEILNGKPLQYTAGIAWFYKMKFKVNENVLIPRPETEELVEWVLENYEDKPLNVIDVGTGSGCIAIAMKKMRCEWNVDAIDVSKEALEIAKQNAESNNVEIQFSEKDIVNISSVFNRQYDLVVSNPPYITIDEAHTLEENVIKHEPALALFAPQENPLFYYDAIVQFAKSHLKFDGSVFVEINKSLAEETFELFIRYFSYVEMRKDISGNFRMLYANGLKNSIPSR